MSETTSDACVSWIEGRVPDTEEARVVHALITERGVRLLDDMNGRAILIDPPR